VLCLVLMAAGPGAQFSSGVTAVEVYATVTDAGGPVLGLQKGDFEVFEDNVRQEVTTFASGDFPLAVALAIDRSVSMQGQPLALAKRAAREFLEDLRPGDRAMLIAVSSEIEVVAPLSTDRQAQMRALDGLSAWSTTSLHDAIVRSIDLIQPAAGRRALVVLSDGVDRYSHVTAADVLERARRSDVLVYPIVTGKTRPALFAEIAALTGGRSFDLRDANGIGSALSQIAAELRNQYLLGYSPRRPVNQRNAGWRAIRVVVHRPGVRVRARDGYFAD
jgi:Ca-activated chloride channel family protein